MDDRHSEASIKSEPMDLVKELLTTAENQRYIRFKNQARYKLNKIVVKTERKGGNGDAIAKSRCKGIKFQFVP